MVRESRIKQYSFPSQTFSADSVTNLYSDNLNGELLSVEYKFNRTGSISLAISGTGEEVFRRNAPSGTLMQFAYPRYFGELTTGSIASASQFGYAIQGGPLILSAGSMGSGTLPLEVTIKYR